MNKNWKKLVSLLLSLTCVLAMSAVSVFAETKSTPAYMPVEASRLDSMLSTSESLIDELCNYTDEELESLKASSYQFTVRAVEAWQEVRDELGELVSYDTEAAEYEVEGEFVTCTIPAEFEKNPATVRVYWNMMNSQATDMTFTVENSMDVLMGEAGLNTVTGLCVVFAVLIFLIIVIYMFGKIGSGSKPQAEEPKKAPAAPAPKPAPSPAPAAPVAAAAAQDDIELQIVLGMAIAMYEEETGAAGGDSYVVRSIRKNRKNNWKR